MLSLSNLISKLNNAIKTNQSFIFSPQTSICERFLKLLYNQGFISKVIQTPSKEQLKIYLKYTSNNSTSSFQKLLLLSTSSKQTYLDYSKLSKIDQGIGVLIISTSSGLLTNQECIKRKIGGAAICFIV
jgi:small subunit ribosomal protein S8